MYHTHNQVTILLLERQDSRNSRTHAVLQLAEKNGGNFESTQGEIGRLGEERPDETKGEEGARKIREKGGRGDSGGVRGGGGVLLHVLGGFSMIYFLDRVQELLMKCIY